MAKSVKVEALGEAISEELTIYHEDITKQVDKLSEKAAKDLVAKTKATAPVGARGSYRRNIASKQVDKSRNGSTYAWYVKPPDYRLTHLLVHGHAKKNGGRTRADPFLANAVNQVLPDYQKAVEEVLKNGK